MNPRFARALLLSGSLLAFAAEVMADTATPPASVAESPMPATGAKTDLANGDRGPQKEKDAKDKRVPAKVVAAGTNPRAPADPPLRFGIGFEARRAIGSGGRGGVGNDVAGNGAGAGSGATASAGVGAGGSGVVVVVVVAAVVVVVVVAAAVVVVVVVVVAVAAAAVAVAAKVTALTSLFSTSCCPAKMASACCGGCVPPADRRRSSPGRWRSGPDSGWRLPRWCLQRRGLVSPQRLTALRPRGTPMWRLRSKQQETHRRSTDIAALHAAPRMAVPKATTTPIRIRALHHCNSSKAAQPTG